MGFSRGKEESKGKKFEYRKRSSEQVKERANQSANKFDGILKDGIQNFKVNDGDNSIRILPPTWENADHYGYDVHVHYNIGPDNQQYLCLQKMKNEACPICEEKKRAVASGDAEYAKQLEPTRRVLIYLIDRQKEKEGIKVWSMPWTLDRDFSILSTDKKTGENLYIDDPEDGYDIEFERKGKPPKVEYLGIQIARRSSSLDNDSALEHAIEKPLPEVLNFFDYDHIKNVFSGGTPKKESDKKSDDKETKEKTPEYTYEEIQELSRRKLDKIAVEELGIDEKEVEGMEDTELANAICEEFKLKVPKKSSHKDDDDDVPSFSSKDEGEDVKEEKKEQPVYKNKMEEIRAKNLAKKVAEGK